MKKLLVLLVVVSTLLLTGCRSVKVSTEDGKALKIVNKGANDVVRADKQKRIYYVLWGLIPITDNTTNDMLADVKEGSEVAVDVHMDFLDYLISAIGGYVSIASHSVTVEVNEK